MSGKVYFRKDRGVFYVQWYYAPHKKLYKIYRYNGELMYSPKIAKKLLARMQSRVEEGFFRIDEFTGETPTDVIPYMNSWLTAIASTLSPATYKDYDNSIRNHLEPFFKKRNIQLHEIQYDILLLLLSKIKRTGKGKQNVMYCLHACLDYAWRAKRIPMVPPFPKKKAYNIVEPEIKWLPEDRQIAIIEAIEPEHQPIFWWLKYHLRRPSEAMALHKEDWDGEIFKIRRTFSRKQLIDRTKTGRIHHIPCHNGFRVVLDKMPKTFGPYFFENPNGHKKGRHYTSVTMNKIWKRACEKVGETIDLYSGLKNSSCSQYINEKGLSPSELQEITDHARLDSVKRYAKMEVARKKELMNREVIRGSFGVKNQEPEFKEIK